MKLNTKKGICTGCHFKLNCSLAEPLTTVWNCSEYEPGRTLETNLGDSPVYPFPPSTQSLCKSCATVSDCSLTTASTVVFHCEQYQ